MIFTTQYNYLLITLLFVFSANLISAEQLKDMIKISILGNDAVFLEPGAPNYQKHTIYYEEGGKNEISVLISNLSDKDIALIDLPFSSLVVTVVDSKGEKYLWSPNEGLTSGAFIKIIYLGKEESILYSVKIKDIQHYNPPVIGKEEKLKVTAKFIATNAFGEVPVDLLKGRIKFMGQIESDQKELTIKNITGLLSNPDIKVMKRKKQMAIEKERMIDSINHDIIIDHFETDDLSLSDTLNLCNRSRLLNLKLEIRNW